MYSVVNGWNNIRFMCCKNHDEPQVMDEMQTPKAIFYACPKYFPKNRKEGEPACVNAIFINDAEKAVNKINDLLGEAAANDNEINLQNVRFTIDNVDYKILKDEGGKMDVAVENRKVVRQ